MKRSFLLIPVMHGLTNKRERGQWLTGTCPAPPAGTDGPIQLVASAFRLFHLHPDLLSSFRRLLSRLAHSQKWLHLAERGIRFNYYFYCIWRARWRRSGCFPSLANTSGSNSTAYLPSPRWVRGLWVPFLAAELGQAETQIVIRPGRWCFIPWRSESGCRKESARFMARLKFTATTYRRIMKHFLRQP